jgi:Zn-finger protein
MITKYEQYCALCGSPATDTHHLVEGRGYKQLADADGLYIRVCRTCHAKIHATPVAMRLSQIVGQLEFEKQRVAEGSEVDDAREQFRRRYNKSFL